MNDNVILTDEEKEKQYLLQLWNTFDRETQQALESFDDFVEEVFLTFKWHL